MKLVDNLWQDIANEQMLQMWPHLVKQRSINGYVAANHHHANHDAVKFGYSQIGNAIKFVIEAT